MSNTYFKGPLSKLTIGTILSAVELEVVAQFNPKDVQVTQPVSWTEHPILQTQNLAVLEYTGSKLQTMQVELFFDGAEWNGRTGFDGSGPTVDTLIERLKKMARVQEPGKKDEAVRRPPYLVVTWGHSGMSNFRCVIESLTIKYTMFSSSGEVLRATVTVTLKECDPNASYAAEVEKEAKRFASSDPGHAKELEKIAKRFRERALAYATGRR